MSSVRQVLGRMLVTAGILGLPQDAHAQVGITSGLAQVALVAHVPTAASMQEVSVGRQTARILISANSGYRLMVKAVGVPTSRIWIKAANGEFQELTATASITVAREVYSAGQSEREIQYTIDSKGGTEIIPIRYEIAINPQL